MFYQETVCILPKEHSRNTVCFLFSQCLNERISNWIKLLKLLNAQNMDHTVQCTIKYDQKLYPVVITS